MHFIGIDILHKFLKVTRDDALVPSQLLGDLLLGEAL